MMLFRKTLAVILAIVLVLSLSGPAFAAAKATATTMKLQSISGTVTITKSTGKSVKYTEGMTLYSGYTITTAAKSYANISVDDTKVLKVDATSSVSLSKSGKKLNLYVNSGSAYYNVTKKLSGSESMNIQTSTMTTGIRGTVGVVTVSNESASGTAGSTTLSLLEGGVSVVLNTAAGISTVPVYAGQTISAATAGGSMPTVPSPVSLSAESIPGFVAVEIAADPVLKTRIEQAIGNMVNVDSIAANAQQKLEQEQKQQDKKLLELEQRLKEEVKKSAPEPTNPVEPSKPTTSNGGGGGNPAPTLNPESNYAILNGASTILAQGIWTNQETTKPRALAAGETLKLYKNVGGDAALETPQPVSYTMSAENTTIDLNGFTLTGSVTVTGGSSDKPSRIIDSGSTDKIAAAGSIVAGTLGSALVVSDNAYCAVTGVDLAGGGKYTGDANIDYSAVAIKDTATLVMKDGSVTAYDNTTNTIENSSVCTLINVNVINTGGTALNTAGTCTINNVNLNNNSAESPTVRADSKAQLHVLNNNSVTNKNSSGTAIEGSAENLHLDERFGSIDAWVYKSEDTESMNCGSLLSWLDKLPTEANYENISDDVKWGIGYFNGNYRLDGTDSTIGIWKTTTEGKPDLNSYNTLTLLRDISIDTADPEGPDATSAPLLSIAKNDVTLDLNGHTLKAYCGENAVVSVTDSAVLTIKDSSADKSGTIENASGGMTVSKDGGRLNTAAMLEYTQYKGKVLKAYEMPAEGERFNLDTLLGDAPAAGISSCCINLFTTCDMKNPYLVGNSVDFELEANSNTVYYTGADTVAFTLGGTFDDSGDYPVCGHRLFNLRLVSDDDRTLLNVTSGAAGLTGVSLTSNGATNPTVVVKSGATLYCVVETESSAPTCTIINNSTTGTALSLDEKGTFIGGAYLLVKKADTELTLDYLLKDDDKKAACLHRLCSSVSCSDFYLKRLDLVDGFWRLNYVPGD